VIASLSDLSLIERILASVRRDAEEEEPGQLRVAERPWGLVLYFSPDGAYTNR